MMHRRSTILSALTPAPGSTLLTGAFVLVTAVITGPATEMWVHALLHGPGWFVAVASVVFAGALGIATIPCFAPRNRHFEVPVHPIRSGVFLAVAPVITGAVWAVRANEPQPVTPLAPTLTAVLSWGWGVAFLTCVVTIFAALSGAHVLVLADEVEALRRDATAGQADDSDATNAQATPCG